MAPVRFVSLNRIASGLLTLCILSNPVAAKTIVAMAREQSTTFGFWYHSSGLSNFLQGRGVAATRPQERQADRDAKVTRLEISPANVTVDLAERVRFVAVGYDRDGNAVGGVKVKWTAQASTASQRARISRQGEFHPVAPGVFTITAQAGGRSAQTMITVRPGTRPNLSLPPTGTRQVSSRDLPTVKVAAAQKTDTEGISVKGRRSASTVELRKRAHVSKTDVALEPNPMPQGGGGGWNSSNYWSADDPENRVGDPPGTTSDGGAGSGNFQFAAPIYSAPGRGIDVSLGLVYNSRVWTKAGTQMSYDNDRGWPAPGFNLGFGKLLGMTINSGCMLVDGNGTRHSYTGNITFYSWGTYGVMHTTDGSFIDYTYWTGTNGVITSAQAKLPNGTVINYGAYSQSGGGVFPTYIEDANGNYISITYVNNAGPRIQTVTDSLGRVINFHYDYNNLLTAVTGPGLSGGTRTLVRLHYRQLALNYGFASPDIQTTFVRDPVPWVLDAIYYPGTGTGYWLYDSYSSYGMLASVIKQRAMTFSSSSLNDMGTVYQGTLTRKVDYSYPLSPDYSLTDAPTYGAMTEWWLRDDTNFDSATTGYQVFQNASPRMTIITLPNGTKSKQLSYNHPGQYDDGLVYHDETYVTDGQPLQSSDSFWEPGAYGSPRPTRVEKVDERGQMTKSEFIYGSIYNQVTDVRDYGYSGELLRSTRTTYQNSTNYTGTCYTSGCYGRHIFNLPLSVEIYGSDNVTRVSRTDYQYDGQPLNAAPNVVMHNQASNPHAEAEGFCYWETDWNDPDCTSGCWFGECCCDGYCGQTWICPYDFSTEYRGNITQITTYTNAANLTGALSETRRYDVTGNLVKMSTSCCEQTALNYTVDTQYAYPESKTRGSATDPNVQVATGAVYDFNTGLLRYATDANGRSSETIYNPETLRVTRTVLPSGAHTDYLYDTNQMKLTSITYADSHPADSSVGDRNVKLLNGRGQVRQEQAMSANNVWDIADTVYDQLGRTIQQTLPYRVGAATYSRSFSYDTLGRLKTVTAADGSTTEIFYNEISRPDVASNLPGETTRVRDAWGRERWGRTDASGRLVEVVEPVFWGDGSASAGMLTTYTYNTLGNLLTITSMSGAQVQQARSFRYDSLGRLTAQKLAERNSTLNDAGAYVGTGTWSDVFTYDDRSNLTSRTDARGVKTVYNYNDPLNRLQSVSWDTSGFGDSANPVLPAATVTYQYRSRATNTSCDPLDPSGRKDITQPASISTAGISTKTICYDGEGRAKSKTLTIAGRPSHPFNTDYNYDSLDRMWRIGYPAEYGNGGAPQKIVEHSYDMASRLSTLTFDGQIQASNIVYNAGSRATSLTVGSGTNQVSEGYSYNGPTGLLESQTITRNGSTLLNLSYDYAGANGKRTGQLTKIYNNLDHANKDRAFEYDALGRLVRATGGQNSNPIWAQRYEYDRYGNRSNVFSYVLEDYVKNFYQSALNRQPTSNELNQWLGSLRAAYQQGLWQFRDAMRNLGSTLFTSQEYLARNRSDSEFVYDLYKAFLYREPDAGGYAYWVSVVPTNGRDNVRLGFELSVEFYQKVFGTSPYAPPQGVTVPRDGLQGIAYDQATNRIANTGWGYDAAGNQTRTLSNGVWRRYQYDAANRLVQVKTDLGAVISTYTYGDDNQRLITEEAGTRTYYVAEGGSVIAEYSESAGSTNPVWAKSYTYLGSRLLASLTPNGSGGEAVEYHHPDRLGTRIVTNPVTGGWSEQATLPFGTALAAESSGPATKRRFTSYDRSTETQLDYAINRHYDAQQGRFLEVDRIGMAASEIGSPQTLNLYAYCINDPVNFIDPMGLMWDYLCEAYGFCGSGGVGADRGWGSVASGFWGPGYLGGNGWGSDPRPGFREIYQSEIRLWPLAIQGDGFQVNYRFHSIFDSWDWAWEGYQPTAETFGEDPCAGLLVSMNIPDGVSVDANMKVAADKRAAMLRTSSSPFAFAAARTALDLWFYNQVKDQGPWDYKYLSSNRNRYEAFGNFNYGATGAAAGYPLDTLWHVAGFVQQNGGDAASGAGTPSDNLHDAYLGIGGVFPYGDNPQDAVYVQMGFEYARCRAQQRRRRR